MHIESCNQMIKEAMFYEKMDASKVHCYLCPHHCKILPGKFGLCGVRKNIDGALHTYAYGEVIASLPFPPGVDFIFHSDSRVQPAVLFLPELADIAGY